MRGCLATTQVGELMSKLKKLAEEFNCAVIVTNQAGPRPFCALSRGRAARLVRSRADPLLRGITPPTTGL